MDNPEVVEVSRENMTAEGIEQVVYPVAVASKTALLLDLLETNNFERVIVFTRTKRGAERLTHILNARDLSTNQLHSNRSQSQRESALRDFKDGKVRVLVATDVASRGIDVDLVSHVINYDVPEAPEDYVHRIGRTGRAGNEGLAITLVTPNEELSMRAIERLTKHKVERVVMEDFSAAAAIQKISSAYKKSPQGQFNSGSNNGGRQRSRPASTRSRPAGKRRAAR
jgi:ATP-dependent RNA helicase RhlE